jgi:CRP-like cAMP-binding protein
VTRDELRELRLLAGVSEAGLDRLAATATEIDATEGQVLALLDSAATGAFVVLEGSVAVELRTRTFELGPGNIVGELALLVPGTGRVARVRAATAVRCLAVPREEFLVLVESEPAFALTLLRELARRLVEVHAA